MLANLAQKKMNHISVPSCPDAVVAAVPGFPGSRAGADGGSAVYMGMGLCGSVFEAIPEAALMEDSSSGSGDGGSLKELRGPDNSQEGEEVKEKSNEEKEEEEARDRYLEERTRLMVADLIATLDDSSASPNPPTDKSFLEEEIASEISHNCEKSGDDEDVMFMFRKRGLNQKKIAAGSTQIQNAQHYEGPCNVPGHRSTPPHGPIARAAPAECNLPQLVAVAEQRRLEMQQGFQVVCARLDAALAENAALRKARQDLLSECKYLRYGVEVLSDNVEALRARKNELERDVKLARVQIFECEKRALDAGKLHQEPGGPGSRKIEELGALINGLRQGLQDVRGLVNTANQRHQTLETRVHGELDAVHSRMGTLSAAVGVCFKKVEKLGEIYGGQAEGRSTGSSSSGSNNGAWDTWHDNEDMIKGEDLGNTGSAAGGIEDGWKCDDTGTKGTGMKKKKKRARGAIQSFNY